MIRAVLFDLDGTFADTAPDLTRALNAMRASRGLSPVPIEATRPVTSTGARGMLRVGFDMTPESPDYPAMREEFLTLYGQAVCVESSLFPGMSELLVGIERHGMRWGIVTNKAERFARPLVSALVPREGCACIVGGDTTGVLKPRPEPLLAACSLLGVEPHQAVYVGDDQRDIAAAHAAGMAGIAVRYGYLNGGDPDTWGAEAVADCPHDVLAFISTLSEPFTPAPVQFRSA